MDLVSYHMNNVFGVMDKPKGLMIRDPIRTISVIPEEPIKDIAEVEKPTIVPIREERIYVLKGSDRKFKLVREVPELSIYIVIELDETIMTRRFKLMRIDCEYLGIPYSDNLQPFPKYLLT